MTTVVTGMKRKFGEVYEMATESLSAPHKQTFQAPNQTLVDHEPVFHSATGSRSPENASRGFLPTASVVIIGVRGVGKSSLAVLASSAYGRRLIEVEKVFIERTGNTPTFFRKSYGSARLQQTHHEILKSILKDHSTACVIVCSFSDLEHDGARVLRDYAQSHPVIHVTRDLKGIQSHVQPWSEEKVKELTRASNAMLRACTNFEFFNISEDMEKESPNTDHSGQPLTRLAKGPFLTLKRAEHDFLRLLRNILGDNARHSSHHSVYPLSKVQLEDMEYPSAVTLSIHDVVEHGIDLDRAQIGVDAVELKVNLEFNDKDTWKHMKHGLLDRISEAFAILRRSTILPIILSVSHHRLQGSPPIGRADVIEHYLRLGPEYCKVSLSASDLDLRHWLANRGKTQLIGSFVPSDRPRHGWADRHCASIGEKARQLGFHFIEFNMPAARIADSFDALAFANRFRSEQLTISAYSSGKFGQSSLLLNPCLTPVQNPERSAGRMSSSVTVKQRNQALFSALIYSPLQFLIYGETVNFSLSPVMHNAAYAACGMSHVFRTHSASNLDDLTQIIRAHDFGGAAIVQPFKTSAIQFLDRLSRQAEVIGAVNTIIPIRDDKGANSRSEAAGILPGRNRSGSIKMLYGDNTDWIGIRACIRRSLSPANTIRPMTVALVCGAGGMARAGVFALITLGVKTIFICNRTTKHAEALAKHYNQLIETNAIAKASSVDTSDVQIHALESFGSPWPDHARFPTIIVSCVPTQTPDGISTNFELPPAWLQNPTAGVVVEIAYMPVVTPVVRQIRELASKGWILMDGLDVLPEQAFAQFELFTGRRAPRKLMRDEALRRYSEESIPQQGALNTDSPSHV